MLKQQAEARERGEELDRQKRLEENKAKKEAIIAAGATRKSSRTTTIDKSEHVKEQISPKKSRGTATATGKGKKKATGKMSIADYFNKKELDTDLTTTDALKKAQEEVDQMGETDAGITAVTKPSASARQPELVTGCVLRDYQVPPHLEVLKTACRVGMAD